MAVVGVRVADPHDDRHLSLVPQAFQADESRVQPQLVVVDGPDRLSLALADGDAASSGFVDGALVGDHGVETVIAAVQGAEHKGPVVPGDR